MKTTFAFLSFLTILSLTPGAASAQTSTATANESTPEPAVIEAHNQRRYSGVIQNRVNELPAEIVQELPIPILFGFSRANLTKNFGDPRNGGRTHEGLDLIAPKGSLIVSPTRAVVLGKGVWTGAGNYVSTANPGGETFVYMHLDSVSPLNEGDVLQPGDLIGYVGNTGNASGGAAHLHFEIRKSGPIDPYPRLTKEFSPSEKIGFVTALLSRNNDKPALVQFLTTNYLGEFIAIKNSGIMIPIEIETEIQRITTAGATEMAAFANLTFGMRSEAVANLQRFLIIQNRGPAAQFLARSGATGYFGTITQNALNEYRGNTPLPAPVATPLPTPAGPTVSGTVPLSNLTLGSRGKDVIWLQVFLVGAKAGPAAQILANAGATGYFGPVTRSALAEYQAKAGISPAVGYFGAITRAYMNATGR